MLYFSRWKILTILAICLFFVILALPNAFRSDQLPSWMPSKKVSLGLDLQGGSHLLLQVDFDAYVKEQMANLVDTIRSKFRAANVGYRSLAVSGGKVVFVLRDVAQKEQAEKILRDIDRTLSLDVQSDGSYHIGYTADALVQMKSRLVDQSIIIVNNRVNQTGTTEPTIQRQGEDRIVLQVPGLQDPEHLKNLLGQTAKMTFHLVDENVQQADLQAGRIPPGTRVLPDEGGLRHVKPGDPAPLLAIFSKVELSGDLLVDANASVDEYGQPSVSFHFNPAGAQRFGEITRTNVGKRFAIVLDNKILTAPVIRSVIMGGNGIITGNFTVESANDLSLLLRAGALPAPLKVIEERTVGPNLGADSIEAGKKASILGVVLVMGFMLISYGLFGVFANIALMMNLIIIVAALSLFQATLTLPGIAGIVLTLGMAVDANVLIYERMREEVRNGKSPNVAAESGFRFAFATITDSNITTMIATLILYHFGTGTIRGFAVTLAIGILASMFTAILLTRLMVATWIRKKRPKFLPI